MHSLKDTTYYRSRALKKGEVKLQTAHQEIVDWLSDRFKVRVLDFNFETKNISSVLHQQVIEIILETIADCAVINTQPNRALIAERFITYFETHDPKAEVDPSKQDAWPFPSNPFPEVIVGFDPLEAIEWRVAWKRAWPEIYKLQNQNFIYTILVNENSQAIFFYRNDQITEDNKKVVLDALLALLKNHDEFGYFGLASFSNTTYFDSKENLDKNYGGDPLH